MVSDANDSGAAERLKSLRADMERELRLRHRLSWGVSLAVLALSILIAGIGAAANVDLMAMLGQWRTGVVVLVGAALLFSFSVLLQHLAVSRHVGDANYARELKSRDSDGSDSPTGTLST